MADSAQILLSRLPALSRSLENAALASAELLAEFWPLVAFAFMPYRHTQTRSFGTPVWSSNFSKPAPGTPPGPFNVALILNFMQELC